MDGGGVTESGCGRDVIRGELALELAAAVPGGEPTVAVDVGDGPAVAVLDPIGGRESEPSIVRTGDDHVADTRPVSVPQTHLWPGRGTVETMITGSVIELSDDLAGRSEHDRVQSGRSILNPSGEGIFGDLGQITDMNTAMIEIEVECAGIAFPQGERGLCFGRVGEAAQLGELQDAVNVLDVAEDAATDGSAGDLRPQGIWWPCHQ